MTNIKEKINPELPTIVKGTLLCKNPRCITTIENEEETMFILTDKAKKEYKCEYCDARISI